ncbi:hypothetical protein [Micromonospora endolithica]|uniref:DUF1440 domain-containing protein n=1 Tax=Micromonospora endolithica TaxID=230091 RepID=A0A3A9YZC7_9ACTN|nr:hypothetical protein [Micromonospora endolithica]RKN41383.1 hypothetical protein D7223_23840 [Micromonospora endolithica]TWJ21799.1 hypothetical protein JD76_01911 [Micromonospora endolithica]
MNAGRLTDGVIAGAVGSTALNIVGYLDMVARARPASSAPDETVGRMARLAHVDLGPADRAATRRSGLGPLLGYGLGIGAGIGFAALTRGRPMPLAMAGAVLGGGVMTMTDASMTVLGVTDPRTWRRVDWLADLVPHLAYGLAAAATWNRLRR